MIDGRILKTRRCGSASRYLGVTLTTGKIKRYALAHRLVAQTFLPNPYELPEINHKDCCGSNNHRRAPLAVRINKNDSKTKPCYTKSGEGLCDDPLSTKAPIRELF